MSEVHSFCQPGGFSTASDLSGLSGLRPSFRVWALHSYHVWGIANRTHIQALACVMGMFSTITIYPKLNSCSPFFFSSAAAHRASAAPSVCGLLGVRPRRGRRTAEGGRSSGVEMKGWMRQS